MPKDAKKEPTGQFARSGGYGDDVVCIVDGPNRGYSGFGFIGNRPGGVKIATIWPDQETVGHGGKPYHEEPAENCRVIRYHGGLRVDH